MNTQNDSLATIQKLAAHEVSMAARLGYVALVLVATGMTAVIMSLWLTEPYLPLRTQAAFGAMTLIGLSWTALSVWALATRRILLARDRVLAGRMAVTFASLFLAGAIAAVAIAGSAAAWGVLATGALMLGVALRVLSGARRRHATLVARREELEQELGR